MRNAEKILERLGPLLDRQGMECADLAQLLPIMHPADLGEFLQDLPSEDQAQVLEVLAPEDTAVLLDSLPSSLREQLLHHLPAQEISRVVTAMTPDAGADVMGHLSNEKEEAVLRLIPKSQVAPLQALMQYDPRTAGGMMTTNFVAVPEDLTAAQTLRHIQGAVDAKTVEYVYVIAPQPSGGAAAGPGPHPPVQGRLIGLLTIRSLLMAHADIPVSTIMKTELVTTTPEIDRAEVSRIVERYNLRALPVVDAQRNLLGVITHDNVVDAVRQELEEDILRLAGAHGFDPIHDPIHRRITGRLPWLLTTLFCELALAYMMRGYESLLAENIALALFMPVTSAMGGNHGLQSSTLIVRGIATGQVRLTRVMRLLWEEILVGLGVGMAAGLISGVAASLIVDKWQIGVIVGTAMTLGVSMAATTGTLIPLLCHKYKVDPALAAGPFISALNDISCVILYLSTAWFFIRHLGVILK